MNLLITSMIILVLAVHFSLAPNDFYFVLIIAVSLLKCVKCGRSNELRQGVACSHTICKTCKRLKLFCTVCNKKFGKVTILRCSLCNSDRYDTFMRSNNKLYCMNCNLYGLVPQEIETSSYRQRLVSQEIEASSSRQNDDTEGSNRTPILHNFFI
ncbi:uncharacterized protein LOC126897471 [Daktulosphaira vitifoliae]|uniref:uncharacterized protein LOC126897471 n=1 Tax=Daktulosphaira vitifoliae TaxID=58002 RepID=UPI0021AA9B71|nr:uncharacterized protein LOC126897471 [Daktulosphaira vitifoliae]